jgi:hypothetical protein
LEILLIGLVISLFFHAKTHLPKLRKVKFLKGFKGDVLGWAVGFCLLIHFLDIISTMLGMRVGLSESNPYMRDPYTLQFVLSLGISVKALCTLFYAALPSYFILRATKNPLLASLPFWWDAWEVIPAVVNNILLLLFKLHGN